MSCSVASAQKREDAPAVVQKSRPLTSNDENPEMKVAELPSKGMNSKNRRLNHESGIEKTPLHPSLAERGWSEKEKN